MAELLRGTLAAEQGPDAPPPRPFGLQGSARRDLDASDVARPVPPLLWQRLDDEQRQAHERAVATYAEANAQAHELAVKARQQAADDEQALRDAIVADLKVPAAKAPALEQQAAEAQRAQEMAGRLVLESGGRLVEALSDADVAAAIAEALEQQAEVIAAIPELVDRLLAELAEAGGLGGQAEWCGRLVETRSQQPWRPASRPASHRLAAAAQHAQEVRVYVAAELSEQAWRDASPPEHVAPAGAPPAGTWVSTGIDPTQ